MIFTVGWHYTKQVFGCMMVYPYFDKYKFTPRQRTITKYALLSIWWLNFAQGNPAGAQNNFSQFKYYSFDLPDILVPITALHRRRGLRAGRLRGLLEELQGAGQRPGVEHGRAVPGAVRLVAAHHAAVRVLFPADAVLPLAAVPGVRLQDGRHADSRA